MADGNIFRTIRTENALRVACPAETGRLAIVLDIVRQEGGPLRAHLVLALPSGLAGLFLCERPEAAGVALRRAGVAVDIETAVVVGTENHGGAMSFLIRTLEAEGLRIAYSFATAWGPDLCLVVRTNDNPRAEDILRNYLVLPDEGAKE